MSLTTLLNSSDPSAQSSQHPSAPSRAWILPVTLLLGFGTIFLVLFGEKFIPSTTVQTARVLTIRDTATPAEGNPTELLFQASGWLEPDPFALQVPALVDGIISEVYVLAGDTVEKGQLLATLVDQEALLTLQQAEQRLTTIRSQVEAHLSQVPEAKARITAANASVLAEKARLAELTDQANRLRKLPTGAVSAGEIATANLQESRQQAILQEAQSEAPRIEAQLETIEYERVAMSHALREAETARNMAQLALDRHHIRAPNAGRILHLHARPGAKRIRNMDDPKSVLIVELYDPQKMQARIDVPLNEAAALTLEQPVELTSELLPDLTLAGTVTSITGEADLQRNTLQVKVEIHNPDDRLRPEMLVRARFYPPSTPSQPDQPDQPSDDNQQRLVIFAPENSLFQMNEKSAKVWVVDTDSRASLRAITLGNSRRENFREIREGLRAGEQVLLPPFDHIAPGTRLNPQLSEIAR